MKIRSENLESQWDHLETCPHVITGDSPLNFIQTFEMIRTSYHRGQSPKLHPVLKTLQRVFSSGTVPFLILLFSLLISAAHAAEPTPIELEGIGIEEHLGETLPLGLTFRNEEGEEIPLRTFFDGNHPVLLSLVYYNCPSLCNLLLNGFIEGLKGLAWTPGEKFQIVTISIDPREGALLATQKKKAYLNEYGRPEAKTGWHFLTGSEENIKTLADAVGFHYRYDNDQKQYAHAAAVIAATPEGKLARYLYGIQFSPRDLRFALLEAGQGKIGNVVDQLLLYCYHYDPKGRKYALLATNIMKGAGGITVIGLTLFIGGLSRKRRRKKKCLDS